MVRFVISELLQRPLSPRDVVGRLGATAGTIGVKVLPRRARSSRRRRSVRRRVGEHAEPELAHVLEEVLCRIPAGPGPLRV